jgi:sarcosine oxidase
MAACDTIVIGLGAMGSAACWQLAKRGQRVLGIERFTAAHDLGSSHGRTRICRRAYFEHPDYVPLVNHVYPMWDELEAASACRLFERCGLIIAGHPRSDLIEGVYRAAAAHHVPIETIPAGGAAQRFRAFTFNREHVVLYEPDAGLLYVEDCIHAQLDLARRHGARLQFEERVQGWAADDAGVVVRTDQGEYRAARLAIATGAWAGHFANAPDDPLLVGQLEVLRKMQLWFPTENPDFATERCPVFAMELDDGFFYGFPSVDAGRIKVAEHTGRECVAEADALGRTLHESDVERVRAFVANHLKGVGAEPIAHSACMYTMTPDEHFILDRHPRHANVAIAAGFSGHGFKFAPLVGSVLADLLVDGATNEPIEFLSIGRFARSELRP